MMKKEVGDITFPIWLIGDSNPKRWQTVLRTPLDPRHPIRHNIWTSVLDEIQDELFRTRRLRLDTSSVYIRNAIEVSDLKPDRYENKWSKEIEKEIKLLAKDIRRHLPRVVICFGSFSYEFARRSLSLDPNYSIDYWRTRRLGEEFRNCTREFSISRSNLFPLLHRSIAGGHFISGHNHFCGVDGANYFEHVGEQIASNLLQHSDLLDIWI